MCYSPDGMEPPQFSNFVRSFAVISPESDAKTNGSMSFIFVIWAIWGAIVDSGYKGRGGVKPSRNDNIGLCAAIGLSVAAIVTLALYGASPEALGHMVALMLALIFSLWEFSRWRIRRKNPIIKYPVGPIG